MSPGAAMTVDRDRRAAIVGTGLSDVARHSSSSLGAHVVQACLRAIEDCGLSVHDIDGLANYPNPSRPAGAVLEGVDIAGVNYVATTLGVRNLRWACSVTQGTVMAALVEAINAVLAGAARHVLVWRGMYNPPGKFGRVQVANAEALNQFTYPYGLAHNVMTFAIPYARYLSKYRKSRADMAAFVSKNRDRVVEDPNSPFFGRPLPVDEYLGSRMIAYPLSLFDCDMPVTGCGAVVVSAADAARDLRRPPAYVAGHVSLGLPQETSPIMQYEHLAASGRRLGEVLWDNAGMCPSDVDQANLYDGFSFYVPFWAEWLGFCGEGEGLDYLRGGPGTTPINTNGGALGRGRLHGTPQLIEAVRQLQGTAVHQVSDARVTLAQAGDPSHGSAAVVLTNEPRGG
jgi:acetyl-CoA acetyltransferase